MATILELSSDYELAELKPSSELLSSLEVCFSPFNYNKEIFNNEEIYSNEQRYEQQYQNEQTDLYYGINSNQQEYSNELISNNKQISSNEQRYEQQYQNEQTDLYYNQIYSCTVEDSIPKQQIHIEYINSPCDLSSTSKKISSSQSSPILNSNYNNNSEQQYNQPNTKKKKKKSPAKRKQKPRHQQTTNQEPYNFLECAKCGKRFGDVRYLTQHINAVHVALPYRCYECGKKFINKSKLRDHKSRHTANDKEYKCDKCPKQFHYKWDLIRHINYIHLKQHYSCDKCGKSFARNDHLTQHNLTHNKKIKNILIF